MSRSLPSTSLLPSESPSSTSYKTRLISNFILSRNPALLPTQDEGSAATSDATESPSSRRGDGPVMISMQGPQGAGKSTLAESLKRYLKDEYGLRVAVVSLDDFYLTHECLVNLAATNPDNKLLHGRGQPGTHDIPLLHSTLREIQQINSNSPGEERSVVSLPVFDKSLFNGEGDRAERLTVDVEGPLDIFILEGWSMGFEPLPEYLISAYYTNPTPPPNSITPPLFLTHPLPSLLTLNSSLQSLSSTLYPLFSLHISITPLSYSYVFDWRLQQEHAMKRGNGGRGMTDEEVSGFVGRYMPAYEVWGNEGLVSRAMAEGSGQTGEGERYWEGGKLRLAYGSEREVVDVREE